MPIYSKRWKKFVAVVLWLIAFGYAIYIFVEMLRGKFATKEAVLPHLAAWLLIPPLWFVIEYNFLFKKESAWEKNFEKFKYGQELNRNLWAGISAILIAVYFS